MLQPWRERILTALLVIVIAVPVGIVIGGGLDFGGPDEEVLGVGDPGAEAAGADTTTTSTSAVSSSSSTTSTAPTTTTAPSRPVGDVKVRFYNGSRTAGAAVTVGSRLDALGYDVLEPGPSPSDPIPTTAIAYRDGFAAEAAAVARALGVGGVAAKPMPPVPAVTGVGDADVVVIVAEDAVRAATP